ncbi:phosphoribosyltransferase family protein [Thermopolyspora sp. NPDC052614]|uniref:ComF family protein n=1 Tax=Thermopolyspora sp. NPDC052614 TaxID=3155682 RepID=UPI003446A9C8
MLGALLDLVLPPRCAGCDAAGAVLCPACTAELRGRPARRTPSPAPAGLPGCWSAAAYDGVARRMILSYKERGRADLAAPLAACLCAVAEAAIGREIGGRAMEGVALVPVPSARSARRARGHDPIRAMAALAARRLAQRGLPVAFAPVLAQRRRVADQAGLSAARRAANLHGAFGTVGPVPRGVCVLVDDVITTGATLAEAARALAEAGARAPLAVTVAATRRRKISGDGYPA